MPDPKALLAADITDADEDWVVRLLGLPDNAFRGAGNDARSGFLKSLDSLDVCACPGSGKTTLLVAKLAILANKWTSGTQGICVLSHTNAARLEIESRLASSSVGQQLLSYPHYVGTIHSFVNTFMAVPWLRSQGYAVKMIDSDGCHEMRWAALTYGARLYLTQKHLGMSGIRVVDADFNVEKSAGGAIPCGPQTPTYQAIQNACRGLAVDGYHCYEDAFTWARDLIQKHPDMVAALRDRFPLVFIDEAQDNSEEQSSLLFKVFCEGPSPAVRERLGDPNQAVFDFVGQTGANTDPFPGLSKLDLPCSHRFGPAIASLSDPLGLAPYAMVGAGPRQPIEGFTDANVLMLFDQASIDLKRPGFTGDSVA
ncbi:MAG: UvrD-helicase domain-containing protein [Thermoleophilia bacterium]